MICFKRLIFFLNAVGKKQFFYFFSYFHGLIKCILCQSLLTVGRSFQPYILTSHALFQCILWWNTHPETIWRGLLTLKSAHSLYPISDCIHWYSHILSSLLSPETLHYIHNGCATRDVSHHMWHLLYKGFPQVREICRPYNYAWMPVIILIHCKA